MKTKQIKMIPKQSTGNSTKRCSIVSLPLTLLYYFHSSSINFSCQMRLVCIKVSLKLFCLFSKYTPGIGSFVFKEPVWINSIDNNNKDRCLLKIEFYRRRPIFIPSFFVKIFDMYFRVNCKLYILSFLRNTTLIEDSFTSFVTPRNNEVSYLMLLLTKMLHYFTRIPVL